MGYIGVKDEGKLIRKEVLITKPWATNMSSDTSNDHVTRGQHTHRYLCSSVTEDTNWNVKCRSGTSTVALKVCVKSDSCYCCR